MCASTLVQLSQPSRGPRQLASWRMQGFSRLVKTYLFCEYLSRKRTITILNQFNMYCLLRIYFEIHNSCTYIAITSLLCACVPRFTRHVWYKMAVWHQYRNSVDKKIDFCIPLMSSKHHSSWCIFHHMKSFVMLITHLNFLPLLSILAPRLQAMSSWKPVCQ